MLANDDCASLQEEIVGAFATFQIYELLDLTIDLTNDSAFTLVCCVWAEGLYGVMRVSR